MPPLPPVPSVILLSFKYTYGSDLDVVLRHHFRYTGIAPGNTNLTNWCNAIATSWSGTVNGLFSTAVTLTQVSAADLTSPTSGNVATTQSKVGTRAGTPVDANTAVLVNWKISRRYRGGKPRTYLPAGVTSDIATPQTWTTAAQTAFQTYVNWMASIISLYPMSGQTVTQTNVSYYQGSTASITGSAGYQRGHTTPTIGPAPQYPIVDTITSGSINIKPATQRRRSGYSV